MNKERMLGKIVLAGTIATGGIGISPSVENDASAATVRTYRCSTTIDKWYPLTQGEIVVVKASGAVIPADETVDGVRQYDNDPDTATIIGLKSKDNTNKTWVINNDYPGSIKVLKCGATFTSTYTSLGREASVLDKRLGVNNPTKRVNLNWIQK